MVVSFELVGLAIVFIWLIVLTILFWQLFSHYNNLTQGVTTKSLTAVLGDLLKQLSVNDKDIALLKKRCDTIEKDGLLHIQRTGLIRFNPFKDTGGDQSFILSFLDAQSTGVVISGLHSRSGTRWYAKKVIQGEGVDHTLSDEEKRAIKEAKIVK